MRLTIRREGPWYTDALICKTTTEMLVDSGSSGTFLDAGCYHELLKTQDITLEKVNDEFEMADGSPLLTYGQFEAPV